MTSTWGTEVSSPQQENITRLLNAAAEGDSGVGAEIMPIVYDELRALAGAYFRHERDNHTLQPTALVHEAYMRLVDETSVRWESRNHFFAVAARVMRNLLVNHAVGKGRAKRGGGWRQVALEAVDGRGDDRDVLDIIALDDALSKLEELDERKARLVELRFFAGLSSDDAADVLDIARSTAAEDWRLARAWLRREIKGSEP
ncbi:MAG: ECF-type sigma factor [Planctomycetota bacterium]|jgi:RNA polymerase sigma factor (TIGR02999 family)